MPLDSLDARLLDLLQRGIEITARPFATIAATLGTEEEIVMERLRRLLETGMLNRFGPLFDAAAFGGAYSLCAMAVPPADFERITALVNHHREVAHNYEREHALNMWFVIAAETPGRIEEVIACIADETGLEVLDLPKEEEYFVGLHLPVLEPPGPQAAEAIE